MFRKLCQSFISPQVPCATATSHMGNLLSPLLQRANILTGASPYRNTQIPAHVPRYIRQLTAYQPVRIQYLP